MRLENGTGANSSSGWEVRRKERNLHKVGVSLQFNESLWSLEDRREELQVEEEEANSSLRKLVWK